MRAVMVATVALVVVNALAISAHRVPSGRVNQRGMHLLYDVGQHLGVGLAVAAVVALAVWLKLSQRPAALLVAGLVSLGVGPLLAEDLSILASRVMPSAPLVVVIGSAAALGLGLGAVVLWVPGLTRGWVRAVVCALGVVVLGLNHAVLQNDYAAVHLALALLGCTVIASGCTQARLPRFWPRVTRALPWLMAVCISLFSVMVRPDTALVVEMLRHEGSIVMPFLSRVQARARGSVAQIPRGSAQWFRSRSGLPDIPASGTSGLHDDGVVLFMSVDSLRADVFFSREHDEHFPFMARLRDEGVAFQQARTPGSQTVYTVTSLFTCLYFSQLYWTKRSGYWPHADETERIPSILARNGVRTLQIAAAPWLVNDWGVTRGFAEEEHVPPPKGTKYTPAPLVTDALLRRLGTTPELTFVFVHYLDAHLGMRRRAPGQRDIDRYLHQMNIIDQQLARIDRTLRASGAGDRLAWILTADHGESFGEHGAVGHASTVYEHAIRVPIVIRSPTSPARTIDTPVSVIDLGPTLLELFGLPTPGRCMGQSLVGFLRNGPDPKLTRPIVAEGRLKRVMIFDNRLKVIVDDHANTEEAYDLEQDPEELVNIATERRAAEGIASVNEFFRVHTLQRPGYRVPMRR